MPAHLILTEFYTGKVARKVILGTVLALASASVANADSLIQAACEPSDIVSTCDPDGNCRESCSKIMHSRSDSGSETFAGAQQIAGLCVYSDLVLPEYSLVKRYDGKLLLCLQGSTVPVRLGRGLAAGRSPRSGSSATGSTVTKDASGLSPARAVDYVLADRSDPNDPQRRCRLRAA